MHVQAVVRQEGADAVGDGRRDLVDRLQLLEAVHRGRQPERGWLAHQAEVGVDVVLFLLLGEFVPRLALQLFLAAFLGGRRRRRRRWWR